MRRATHTWLTAGLLVVFFTIGYLAPDLLSQESLSTPMAVPMATTMTAPGTPTVNGGSTPQSAAVATASPVPTRAATSPSPSSVSPTPSPEPTATVAPEATPTPPPPSPTSAPAEETPTQPVVHTVKEGDTISGIADLYGVTVQDLLDANGLAETDTLQVGQQLSVPVRGRVTYTVQSGDTIFAIAERFGVAVDQIVSVNGLPGADSITEGQELIIPAR